MGSRPSSRQVVSEGRYQALHLAGGDSSVRSSVKSAEDLLLSAVGHSPFSSSIFVQGGGVSLWEPPFLNWSQSSLPDFGVEGQPIVEELE